MTALRPITVIVADDHAGMRKNVRTLLDADGGFVVVGEAENGQAALKLARTLVPDVILMDISMPVLNGLEATRQIVAAHPATKVIILSACGDKEYVERASAVGAAGFLAKQAFSQSLINVIRDVVAGCVFFSPLTAQRPPRNKPRLQNDGPEINAAGLTSRESEVLQLLAGGAARRQVALKLHISPRMVHRHLRQLTGKLKIHETADLARFATVPALIESSVQLTVTG